MNEEYFTDLHKDLSSIKSMSWANIVMICLANQDPDPVVCVSFVPLLR